MEDYVVKNIKVFCWLKEANFGDMLNIDLCQKLFSVNPIIASPEECEATFIGSTLDDFLYEYAVKWGKGFNSLYQKEPIKIWGSGFIAAENEFIQRKYGLHETYFRRFKCCAVRGHLSLVRLKKIDRRQSFENVVLGDPGLLASMLLSRMPEKKYHVGLIPHHIELDLPIWEYIHNVCPKSKIIRVDNKVEDVIRQVAQCEVIFSSAMHGLIVSDAFNIPNVRVVASNKLLGGDYKFNDYYSVFGIKNHRKIDLYKQRIDNVLINSVVDDYIDKSKMVKKICDDLMRTFPYK
jgi:hypothetical protein